MQKIAILYKKEQGLLFTADVSTVYRVIVSTQLEVTVYVNFSSSYQRNWGQLNACTDEIWY